MATPEAKPLVEIVQVTKRFPGVVALDNVSFSIARGEVHALLGENGAGKSTLIKLLTGVFPPDGGEIRINGNRVAITNPHHALQLGISAIYQDPILVATLNVEENILLGREPRNGLFIDRKELNRQASKVLRDIGLDIDLGQRVSSLSPGRRQLVAIAKALSVQSQLLIMDEPSAALTDEEIRHLFDVIYTLRSQGISIIYVTHRMEEVFKVADRVTVLRDGKFIGTRSIEDTSNEELVQMIVGRSIVIETLDRKPPAVEVALEVNRISRGKQFQDVSFKVHTGEVVALAGLVGSGRTDIARAIFGAAPVGKGQIRIYGKEVTVRTPREAIQNHISMVPEDRKGLGIIPKQSVSANISIANLRNYSRYGFIQFKQESDGVLAHIRQLRITPAEPDRKVMFLSGGNQQKVVLAKALESKANILILDEPTAGVDVGAKTEIRTLINQLADRGTAILLISSEIPEVLALANRILVMKEGKVVGELEGDRATSEKIMQLAMTGVSP